ncbi:MAG: hypothetical protein ACRD4Y_16375, partial [Candidatus Acidiferrales bacterium]
MTASLSRVAVAFSLAVLIGWAPVAPTFAQQMGQKDSAPPAQPQPNARTIPVSNENYSFGKHWFPNVIGPYTAATVPEPVLVNSPG